MTVGLTARQAECLAIIERSFGERGIAPSLGEICEQIGLASKSGALRLLDGLEERGYIRRLSKRARAIELIHQLQITCPHCGHVAGSTACRAAAQNANPPEPRTRSGISLGGDQAPPAGAVEGHLSSETSP